MKHSSLILVPNLILKQRSQKVADFGPGLQELAQTMTATMRENNGMGLAAPQVGQPIRLIVAEYIPAEDQPSERPIPLTVLVNPTITETNKQTDTMGEGCLSIPGLEIPVERPTAINVLAQDLEGKRVKIRAKDLLARILQHEIDHINGTLIVKRAYPKLGDLAGLRVLFLGTPSHAIPYLSALAATDATVVGVVTETDKPAGRGQKMTTPPVKQLARQLGLPVFQFDSLKNEKAQQTIAELKPDLAIVVAYGQLIPKPILELVPYGFLNIHFSLLPKYRGPSPHQSAILAGEKETGVTIFRLDEGLDTGPIVGQKKLPIEPSDTASSLVNKLVRLSVELLLQKLPGYLKNQSLRPQDESQATYTKLLTKEDGRIDWQKPVELIDRQIRALQPWPIAFTEINSKRLLIHRARRDGDWLVLDVVQVEGKKPTSFLDYLRQEQTALTFWRETGKVKLN